MKNIFSSYLPLLVAVTFLVFSCKKDDDNENVNIPSVSISAPLTGSTYSVYDTVIVTVSVSSEKIVSSLIMKIIDDKGIQVGEAVSTNPGKTSFIVSDALIISDPGIAGGNYKVVVNASDGSQTGISSVVINIIPIPKRYRGLIVISQQNILKTIVSRLDTLNELNIVKNLNHSYTTSALSSYWQQLLISNPSPSTLNAYRLDNYNVEWQFSAPSPYPEIPVIYTDYSLIYAGIGNGAFIEFNSAGMQQVNSMPIQNAVPEDIFRFNDYILMDNTKRNDTRHLFTVSYAVSGALFTHREVDFDVIGFAAISNEEVVIFANQNDQAIIKIFNVMEDELNDGVVVPEGKFYDMIDINTKRTLVLHDNGILLYQSMIDQISIYIPTQSAKFMEFNSVDNMIYAAKDTVITVYDYNTGGIIDFIISPYTIKDMHVFYNRQIMDYEIKPTGDGSLTLYSKIIGDTYHSSFGAIQESQYIFIENGLNKVSMSPKVNILEIGFGTGLNALLSLKSAIERQIYVDYTAIEPFPLDHEIIDQLNYADHFNNEDLKKAYSLIHKTISRSQMEIIPSFLFEIMHESFQDASIKQAYYDLVYFDAFGPDAQPEMWTQDIFHKVYSSMRKGALLMTFSAKGLVKKNLRSTGFRVKRIDGPPGKRHILRAIKQQFPNEY